MATKPGLRHVAELEAPEELEACEAYFSAMEMRFNDSLTFSRKMVLARVYGLYG